MESATGTRRPMRPRAGQRTGVAGTVRAAPAGERSLSAMLRDYLALTKPRIISLLLLTTVATMFVADPCGRR